MPTRRISIAVVAAAMLAAAPAASAHGCANANRRANTAPAGTMRSAVVCLINKQRAERGLPALHQSNLLDNSAQGWTNWMVRNGEITHGADFSARISAAGFRWSWAGENIAAGFSTPNAVVRGWMSSYGHCQNILDPDYSRVGTGVTSRKVGPYRGGTWTQDFALPMSASPPSGNWGPADGCPY